VNPAGPPAIDHPGRGQVPWHTSGLHGRPLLLVGPVIAFVYLLGVTNQWWPTSDSALYLGLGRSLAAGEGYRFNGQPHNHVAPGLPLLLAGIERLVGARFWAFNLAMCLIGLGAALVIYRVLASAVRRDQAALVALATAASYSFYVEAHRILTDMPFALLFWMSLGACLRFCRGPWTWLVAVGALSILGVVVRVPGLVAFAALAAALMLQWRLSPGRPRAFWAGATIVLSLAACALVLLATAYRLSPRTPPYARVLVRLGDASPLGWLRAFAGELRDLASESAALVTGQSIGPVGLVLLLLGVIGSVVLWAQSRRLWATLWILYPLMLAACGGGAVRARYLLPVLPAMLYAMLTGLETIVAWWRRRRPGATAAAGGRVSFVLVGILVLINAPKILRHAVWQSYRAWTGAYYESVLHGRYDGLPEMAWAVKLHTPANGLVIVSEDERIVHYWSGRRTATVRGPLPLETPEPLPPGTHRVPAADTCVVLRLPEDSRVAPFWRDAAGKRTSGITQVFKGPRYEVYKTGQPPRSQSAPGTQDGRSTASSPADAAG